MRKRILGIMLSLTMLTGVLTGCGNDTKETQKQEQTNESNETGETSQEEGQEQSQEQYEEGSVLRIFAFNEEFQSRFQDYFEAKGLIPDGVTVEWVITPNADNAYQDKLDQQLLGQEAASPDERVDLFVVEADYALKYVNSDFTVDVINEIGLTEDDIKNQYRYTQDITIDENGALKGVTWQATPGLFAYRRSIAKDVLGTDEPSEVQAYLSDWNKFDETAEKMNGKGYKMLSGFDDSYRTFSNNTSKPWVDGTNIVVDENLMRWVDQTKTYTDNGYNNKTSLWSDGWSADQGPDGKVFGFFYSTWGINFTLLGNSLATPVAEGGTEEVGNGIYGDWAVCEGPQNYYWGGSWICGAAGSDNISLIRDIMYTLTCDTETMKQITVDTQDYTNNMAAMEELANSDFSSAFLGGQNHIALFADAAPKINMENMSSYDQGLNEEFQKAFKDYFDGNVTKEQALENFYKGAEEKYPELTH